MTLRVRKSPAALLDLRQQAIYFFDRSPDLAERFLNSAEATFALLAKNPELGTRHKTTQSRLAGLRTWSMSEFPRHVVFYRQVDEGVEIVRVIDGARDLDALLGDD